MKRAFASLLFASVALSPIAPTAVAADLDAQDFLILRQTVENHQTALDRLDGLNRRLAEVESKLAESRREITALRQVNAVLTKDLVTQDQLKALVARVELIDHNRAEDSKRIYETLKKFADAPPIAGPVAPAVEKHSLPPGPEHAAGSSRTDTRDTTDPGTKPPKPPIELPATNYEHEVHPGETVSGILLAYRKEYGLKTTMAHIEAANPGLNPKKLKEGQKINIPIVK